MDYPQTRTCDQVDDFFGTTVADPYRWLEDVDSPEVAAWVAEQNALTRSRLDPLPGREQLLSRLRELTDIERFSTPGCRGDRYFFSHNSGLQDQDVLMWQEGLDGSPRVLLDPAALSEDGTVAVTGVGVSLDGRLLAYGASDGGSDWMTWRVRRVQDEVEDLEDEISWVKFSGVSWLPDGSGFYYSGYGLPVDAGAEASLKDTNYFHKAFLHRIGTPQTEDQVVYERPDDKELLVFAEATEDGAFLALSAVRGSNPDNQLVIRSLATGREVEVSAAGEAEWSVIENDGSTFWIRTTLDAPLGRVVAVDLERPTREHWREVLPQSSHALGAVSLVNDQLIAHYLVDARSVVEVHHRDGGLAQVLELPGIGTATGFGGRREDTETFYRFSNFVTPGTIYRLDLETRTSTPYRVPVMPFDPADYVTEQVFVTSKDGTQVPLFVTRRADLVADGTNLALLYGYGGFNNALTPEFAASRLAWMERGGVFAQAGLRGGGEYGEAWHEAGTRLQKQNVFDDFIACAEWLIAQGWTRPERLAIQGGSNGGLLVAVAEQQRPELFGAVLAQVGVMDMMRFDRFTIGWGWKSDYGAPSEDEAESRALLAYSPVHNVRPGTRYPATLVMTGDHDDRVFPAHSFKFAAAMQAGQAPDGPPILLRVETRAGHGAGMPLSKALELVVDQHAFLAEQLGAPSLAR